MEYYKDYEKPATTDIFDKLGCKHISEDEQKELLTESIRSAWEKNDDRNLNEMVDQVKSLKIKNVGDSSAIELIGKLAMWMNQVGVVSVEQ